MLSHRQVLQTVRSDLQRIVLPAVADPQARATVVAALGVLGEVAPRVRDRDDWCRASVCELLGLAGRLDAALAPWPEDRGRIRICRDRARAVAAQDPGTARRLLLEAAEVAVVRIWRDPSLRRRPELLRDVRAALRRDVRRECALAEEGRP